MQGFTDKHVIIYLVSDTTSIFEKSIFINKKIYNSNHNVSFCKNNITFENNLFKVNQNGIIQIKEKFCMKNMIKKELIC